MSDTKTSFSDKVKELTIKALANCDQQKMSALSSSVDNGSGVDIHLEFSEQLVKLVVEQCAKTIAERDASKDTLYSSKEVSEHYKLVFKNAKYSMALELFENFNLKDNQSRQTLPKI